MISTFVKRHFSTALSFMLLMTGSFVAVGQQPPPPSTGYSGQGAPLAANDLQQLVAPIALYPDALVAQILGSATFPDQVAAASGWLQQNNNLTATALMQAVDGQPRDPSVKALTQFPSVLDNLAKNLSWTSALGEGIGVERLRQHRGWSSVQPQHRSLWRHPSNLQRLRELRKLGRLQERPDGVHPASNNCARIRGFGTNVGRRQRRGDDGCIWQRGCGPNGQWQQVRGRKWECLQEYRKRLAANAGNSEIWFQLLGSQSGCCTGIRTAGKKRRVIGLCWRRRRWLAIQGGECAWFGEPRRRRRRRRLGRSQVTSARCS
jgi:hypothetical protein